jgi:uncharacterized surface protein with fasciclin (FAS1) repeats
MHGRAGQPDRRVRPVAAGLFVRRDEMTQQARTRAIVPVLVLAGLLAAPVRTGGQSRDIVDTAIAAGSFKTLVAAVQAAGLVDVLKRPGPYTVFAPTDEAFAKIPKADLDALLKDKAKLTAVLTYHVLASSVTAADLAMMMDFGTVQGGRIKIDKTKGLRIDNATVIKADVAASNGVIHVIDTVLMPK